MQPFTLHSKKLAVLISTLCCGQAFAQSTSPIDANRVEVVGARPQIVRSTSAATRVDSPIESIPQSVVSLPRSVIDEQGAVTMSDALRNVSNVSQIDARDANNSSFMIRGFKAGLVIDGVAMPGYFHNQESLAQVRDITVVKGPTGGLFGSGQATGSYPTLGGTLAITTLAPEAQARRNVTLHAGSYSDQGISFDVNQPLNDRAGIRIIGEHSRRGFETESLRLQKTSLYPSFSVRLSDRSDVTLRLRYQENQGQDYSGLPPYGTVLGASYQLPRSQWIRADGLPDTTQRSQGGQLQWRYGVNQDWSLLVIAAHNEAQIDQRGVFPFPYGGAGQNVALAGARLWDKFQTTTLSSSLTGRVSTGAAQHTLLLAADIERTRDDAFMTYSNGMGFLSMLPTDLLNPAYPTWAEPAQPSPPDQRNRYQATTLSVQDQIKLGDWHLLAGLRHQQIKTDDSNPAWMINNHSSVSKTTPRFGLAYALNPAIHVFAGYNEGIKVPTGAIFSSQPKPEQAKQTEIGVKLKDWNGISATLAWFDLTRRNAIVADSANPGFSIQTGEQRSKGVDLDLRWTITSAWSILASLTSQTPTITADTNPALVGKQLFNIPKRSARLATRYHIQQGDLRGVSLGLGVTHHSALPGDTANTFTTPAATVWDGQISYRKGGLNLSLSVQNLLNKQYFVPTTYFAGGQVLPALPRTVVARVGINF